MMKVEFTKKTLTVREAINYVIKGICGRDAVSRIQEAEGLALTSKRTACLIETGSQGANPSLTKVNKGFVYLGAASDALTLNKAEEASYAALLAFFTSEKEGRPVAIQIEDSILDQIVSMDVPTEQSFEQIRSFLDKGLGSEKDLSSALEKAGFSLKTLSKGSSKSDMKLIPLFGEVSNSEFTRKVLRIAAEKLLQKTSSAVYLKSHPKYSGICTLQVEESSLSGDLPIGLPVIIGTTPLQIRQSNALHLVNDKGILILKGVVDKQDPTQSLFFPSELMTIKQAGAQVLELLDSQWDALNPVIERVVDFVVGKTAEPSLPFKDLDTLTPMKHKGLPLFEGSESNTDSDDETWKFHLLGNEGLASSGEEMTQPLASLALDGLFREENELNHYPLVVQPDHRITTLKSILDSSLEEMGSSVEILSAHRDFFILNVLEALRDEEGEVELLPALRSGLKRFLSLLEVSEAGRTTLNQEIDKFFETLPEARILALGPDAGLRLYLHAMAKTRSKALQAFAEDTRILVRKLKDILKIHDSKAAGKTAGKVSGIAGSMFKTDAPSPHMEMGSVSMSKSRLDRINSVLKTLENFLVSAEKGPEIHLISRQTVPVLDLGIQLTTYQHEEPLEVARGIFHSKADDMAQVFLSKRIAKLEAIDAFDEDRHGHLLHQFNMSTFTEDDWSVFPGITVLDEVNHIKNTGMNAFSDLLGTPLPIHLLLRENPWKRLLKQPESSQAIHRDLGYLAMSHKDAFVLRSSISHPEHMVSGFERMAGNQIPSVSIILEAEPSESNFSWSSLYAFLTGRAASLYTYDPSAGYSWAEKFNIQDSPAPEEDWVSIAMDCLTPSGDQKQFDLSFTFADAVTLLSNYRHHFMVIGSDRYSDNQVYLAEYLKDPEKLYGKFVPYIWVLDSNRKIKRAILSRELALRCRDRLALWNMLEELGGINNSHAMLMGEQIRQAAESSFQEEIEELKLRYQEEIEAVRTDTARDALGQLARVLVEMEPGQQLNLGGSAPTVSAPAEVSVAPSGESAPAPEAVKEEAEPESEEMPVEEAYVDTELCTSCNECVTVNPLMFQYNSNKQVELADPTAGTFLQLVSSAEKCPSRCIHPGSPRPGDSTVTDELIAKAAKYN